MTDNPSVPPAACRIATSPRLLEAPHPHPPFLLLFGERELPDADYGQLVIGILFDEAVVEVDARRDDYVYV
jgi:hypothetical protein